MIRYYKEFTCDKDVTQTQQDYWTLPCHYKELGLKDSIIQEIAEDIYDLNNYLLKGNPFYIRCIPSSWWKNNNAKLIVCLFQSKWIRRYIHPKEAGITVTMNLPTPVFYHLVTIKLKKLKDSSEVIVIPGFFGVTHEGHFCTFSVAGSDITGSIIAAGKSRLIRKLYRRKWWYLLQHIQVLLNTHILFPN